MIYIKRIPADLSFVNAPTFSQKMKKEFDAAKVHFTTAAPGTFKFSCYKHEEIKDKLKIMFNGKCAYCDSSILHITAGDIEHFRPKSIYWWLACHWDNLLFACEKCNRSGKNDAFPLANKARTACKHDSSKTILEKEDKDLRLLLNPCKEDPELFFSYDEKRATISPLPLLKTGTRHREMAEVSIATYQLQRHELVQEREKALLLLLVQIDYTKKTMEDYNRMYTYPKSISDHFETRMKEAIKKLLLHLHPSRQYLGMSRQLIRKFFIENNIELPDSLKKLP
jgi:uncharacterized protein (TIGR02646 family)